MTTSYRELEFDVFNVEDESKKWINLGYWKADTKTYAEACRNLALLVASKANLKPGANVLELGCGCGESLVLWSTEMQVRTAIGVNISQRECQEARKLVIQQNLSERVQVVQCDAVQFLERAKLEPFFKLKSNGLQQHAKGKSHGTKHTDDIDTVISIDAAYHFVTRSEFLRQLSRNTSIRPGAKFACADIMLSPSWARRGPSLRQNSIKVPGGISFTDWIWKAPLHALALYILGKLAGVPIANLCYDSNTFVDWCQTALGVTDIECSDITNSVLPGFQQHMQHLAMSCCGNTLLDRWTNKSYWIYTLSASFFGMLNATGALRFVVYSGKVRCSAVGVERCTTK